MPRTLTPAKQREQWQLNGEAELLQFEQQAVAPCRMDPAAFVDYEDPDAPEVFEAQVTCGGCPFLTVCRARARLERPVWGVRGGEVWGYSEATGTGKIIRRQSPSQLAARTDL